jgi:hypothetical protein
MLKTRAFLKNNKELITIIAIAIIVKSIVFYLALDWLGGDEFDHITRAQLLSLGLTPYIDFFVYSPGLMVIAAIPHLFLNTAYLPVRALTALVDVGNVILIFLYAEHLYTKKKAILASVIYALNYLSITASATYMGEPYGVFMILSGIYLAKVKGRIFLASMFFSAVAFIKPHYVLFWIPVLGYMIYKKTIDGKIIGYIALSTIIFSVPLLCMLDDFTKAQEIHYIIRHNSLNKGLEIENIALNMIMFIASILLFETFIILALIAYILHKNEKIAFNEIHVYFLSNLFFIIFPDFFPTHHMLITLPASCIIASDILMPKITTKPKIKQSLILLAILTTISPYPTINDFGYIPYKKADVLIISDHISNTNTKGYILQDYGFYSYFSDKDDVTGFGFNYGEHYGFTHEYILYLINQTRPKYIIVSTEYTYPKESLDFFSKNFEKIKIDGSNMYPILYETGYVNSSKNYRLIYDLPNFIEG